MSDSNDVALELDSPFEILVGCVSCTTLKVDGQLVDLQSRAYQDVARFSFDESLSSSQAPGFSADFQKGLDAYNRGDYQAALREWRPFAEQGDGS